MNTGRGILKDSVKDKYGITTRELRLMPYFLFCLMDNIGIEPSKISPEERNILSKWQKEGKITRTCSQSGTCTISKEFFKDVMDILYECYIPKLEKEGEI